MRCWMVLFLISCASARPPARSGGEGGGDDEGGEGGVVAIGGKTGNGGANTMPGTGGAMVTPDAAPAGDTAPSPSPDTAAAVDAVAAGGVALAGEIHKHLRTLKCGADLGDGKSCRLSADMEKVEKKVVFGGDPAVTYEMKLQVRGLVEPRGYTGGALQDPSIVWLYVGGMPGGPGDDNRYGSYSVSVSDPKQVYYLNRDHMMILKNPALNHSLFKLDYVATIKVKGGATVSLINADTAGSGMIRNHEKHVVPGVPTELLPQPWDGQFLYFEVDSVTPVP
jgi:hypothetical protein